MCIHVYRMWAAAITQKLKFLAESSQRASDLSCIDSELQTVCPGEDPGIKDHEIVPQLS